MRKNLGRGRQNPGRLGIQGFQATGRSTASGGIVEQNYNYNATVGMEIQEIPPRILSTTTTTD
jgi:hypothetical protein